MQYIIPKRSCTAIFRTYLMWLFTALLFGTTTTTASALEETANAAGDVPYQSVFEDYRAISKDTLADWKAINQSTEGGVHSGHQMHDMEHDMPSGEPKSAESSMDHSNMDHGKMVGGEIVCRHGIGVLSLPASEGVGHNHQQNSEHSDEATTADGHMEHQHDTTQGESHEH